MFCISSGSRGVKLALVLMSLLQARQCPKLCWCLVLLLNVLCMMYSCCGLRGEKYCTELYALKDACQYALKDACLPI